MFVVTDTKRGPCPLCMKDKDVELFIVEPQLEGGYSGDCCGKHLAVLVESAKNGKQSSLTPQERV